MSKSEQEQWSVLVNEYLHGQRGHAEFLAKVLRLPVGDVNYASLQWLLNHSKSLRGEAMALPHEQMVWFHQICINGEPPVPPKQRETDEYIRAHGG